jgi:hypothetical protein
MIAELLCLDQPGLCPYEGDLPLVFLTEASVQYQDGMEGTHTSHETIQEISSVDYEKTTYKKARSPVTPQ